MLEIELEELEAWDDKKQEFVVLKNEVVCLEHSLKSISEWEAKWKVPFLDTTPRTKQMILDYVSCMVVSEVPKGFLERLKTRDFSRIQEYIDDSRTASWISSEDNTNDGSKVTSELIYYWMVTAGIPFSAEEWHLNRLMMLIKIYGEKNKPEKKRSREDILERNRELNEKRRREMGTNG